MIIKMNKTMNQYMGKVLKALMMLFAVKLRTGWYMLPCLLALPTMIHTSQLSEDDDPRILNTDLADPKLDRKTNLKLEIKVTPVHYTTVTWFLDDTQIAEGTTIDQALPVGNHELEDCGYHHEGQDHISYT